METSGGRELLVAALAVQLKGVPLDALQDAVSVADSQLADLLSEKLELKPQEAVLVEALANELITSYGGISAALNSFSGLARAVSLLKKPALSAMSTVDAGSGIVTPEVVGFPAVEEAPGRYTVLARHASGGMGQILLVRDEYLGRTVALKEFLQNSEASPAVLATVTARFLQEARITGRLEHPSIVPVYELGRRQDGTPYFTMRLVKGKTLSDALRASEALAERMSFLAHLIDACQAVAYAHSRGIVHRDIKPDNIMVGDFGETVVLDWGLAKASGVSELVNADSSMDATCDAGYKTAYGRALGTPKYMSPEQARGELEHVDERSDVYSLGAVLYEILTGSPPHAGRTREEAVKNLVSSTPTPVLQKSPQAPPELAGICEKALRPTPEDRYESAVALAEDIQRFVTGRLVRAYQYSAKEVLLHYYRKHKALVQSAIIFLLVVAAVIVYAYVSIIQARNTEREQRRIAEEATAKEAASRAHAEREAYLSQLALVQQYLNSQNYTMANEVLWSMPESQRTWEWQLLLNQANPEFLTVSTAPFRTTSVTISPDSRIVASASNEGPVQLWDLQTGKLLRNCEGEPFLLSGPCRFSPSGELLVAAGLDGGIRVWTVTSGQRLSLLTGHAMPVFSADFVKDGTDIVSASLDGSIRLWNLSSGICQPLLQGSGGLTKAVLSPDGNFLATVSQQQEVQLWRWEKVLTEQMTCPGREVVFNAAGTMLATITGDETVTVWDCRAKKNISNLPHPFHVSSIAFSQSSDTLLSASADSYARLFNVNKGEMTGSFFHEKPLIAAGFLQDNSLIFTCSVFNDFKVWHLRTGSLVNSFEGNGKSLSDFDLSNNGAFIATAANEDSFQIWSPTHRTGSRLLSYGREPTSVALAASKQASVVSVFDVACGLDVFSLDGVFEHTTYTGNPLFAASSKGVAVTDDGSKLAVLLDHFVPMVVDLQINKCIQLFGHTAGVQSIAFDNSGKRIVTASVDTTARIWESESGQLLKVIEGHSDMLMDATFSPDGARIVTACRDGAAYLWDVKSGQQLLILPSEAGGVRCVEFSPEGDRIFTSGDDKIIHAWDSETGASFGTLQGPREPICSLMQVDSFILSSSFDRTSRVWDARDFRPLLVLSELIVVTKRPEGLLTACADGRIEMLAIPRLNEATSINPETYKAYRRADHARNATGAVPPMLPAGIVSITSKETAESVLQKVLEWATNSPLGARAEGCLPEELPLPSLGLERKDIINEICGTVAGDAHFSEEVISTLASLNHEEGPHDFKIAIRRGDKSIPVKIIAESSRKVSLTASLTPERAAAVLRTMAETASGLTGASPKQQDFGLQLDVFLPNGAILKEMLEAQLCPLDIVIDIDGHRLGNEVEDLVWLKELAAEVLAGEKKEYTLHIRRGEFLRLTVLHTINDS